MLCVEKWMLKSLMETVLTSFLFHVYLHQFPVKPSNRALN